ncbi:MAG TPA: SRPBCC family protein [Roseiflexaceae bacterium]|nr:SRPBCC family protein [Roseiflexaceae bacterium]
MSEYEHTVTISATPEAIFAYVADLRNMPHYLPTVLSAEPLPEGRVRLRGQAGGRRYDVDGYLHSEPELNRMEWGADGDRAYAGRLEIHRYGTEQRALLTVHLSFGPHAEPAEHYERAVQHGLEDALNRIQSAVEERNGTLERTA